MFRFASLRARIIMLTTVPLAAVAAASLLGTIQAANDCVRSADQTQLSAASAAFARVVAEREKSLLALTRVVAQSPEVVRALENGETFHAASDFGRSLSNGAEVDFIEVFDREGMPVFVVDGGMHAHDVQPLRSVTMNIIGVNGDIDVGRRRDSATIAAIAIVQTGARRLGAIRAGWYADQLFLNDLTAVSHAELTLYDNTGTLIATTSSDPQIDRPEVDETTEVFTSKHITRSEVTTLDGTLGARIGLRGFRDEVFEVFVTHKLETGKSTLAALQRNLVIAGILAVLLTMLASFFFASSITRPLHEVVAAAEALEHGEFDRPLTTSGSDEIAYVVQSVERMRQSLHAHVERMQNVDQMKSNFIALAGHELRTPLTIISGFNELIVSGSLGELPDQIKESARHIQDQLTDLNLLVGRILDLTSIEQGLLELSVERTNIVGLLKAALEKRWEIVRERGLYLLQNIPHEPIVVDIDAGRIEQAVLNLVDNAIKFTPGGGRITVNLVDNGKDLEISVKDTGIGIPANELNWIFEKLYEGDDILHHSSGKHKFNSRGLGLGLALTKAFVQKHGGEVRAKSALGRGSEFTIVLKNLKRATVDVVAPLT
jgi:signal transduction histidine kinase